jgi:hypothetical protein
MLKVEDFKDKHKNKLGFIYGAGPSLHFIDVEKLKNYISITVNSGLLKCPWCNYFVSYDIGVKSWNYYSELLPTLNCTKFLYREKLSKYCNNLSNVSL